MTTKQIVSAIVEQAAILTATKAATKATKTTKATATDAIGRAAIQAVLDSVLDTVKQGVKDHGEATWTAARGSLNGAAQFANEVKARPFTLPKRDRAEGWMVAGEAVTVVTADTLTAMTTASEGDTPISSFLTAKRADKKTRTTQAEIVAQADDDCLGAFIRHAPEAKEHRDNGEDIVTLRAMLDAEALGKAVVTGRALKAEAEAIEAEYKAEAEAVERVHMVIGDLPSMADADLDKLAQAIGQEQAKRAAPAKRKTA